MPHLFLFTIGPVQSFIEQARRTRDLFAGSAILSDLIREGISVIEKDPDGLLIFPVGEGASLPNRFVVRLEGKTDSQIKEIADQCKQAVTSKWQKLSEDAFKKAAFTSIRGNPRHAADAQIEDFLNIHWAAVDITHFASYTEAYIALESRLGSAKNVRQFEQFSYNGLGEQGKKCHLDGERNALFFGVDVKVEKPGFWNADAFKFQHDNPKKNPRVGPTEGLSALGLTKRYYKSGKKDSKFPSTAGIALLEEISALKEMKEGTTALKAWNNFRCEFWNEGEEFDEQLYYAENLTEDYFDKHGLGQLKCKLPKLRQYQARFADKLKTRYYALVLFDGDQMGKWLSGEKLEKGTDREAFHKKFSELLGTFAKTAQQIVSEEQRNGATVYAGGDDFLGFVNIHRLFEVMAKLRKEYKIKIDQKLENEKEEDEKFTFSAGIVIAHYKTPLSEVLKMTRRVEQKAKQQGRRNAFCITTIKHSGEIQETVMKWGKGEATTQNWESLQKMVGYLVPEKDEETAKFSPKFIQSLSTELMELGKSMNPETLEKIVTAESKRLLKRAKASGTSKEMVEGATNTLVEIWSATNDEKLSLEDKVQNFIHALQIIDFFTRKTNARR